MFVIVKDGHVINDGDKSYSPGQTMTVNATEGKRLLKYGLVTVKKADPGDKKK